MKSLLPQAPEYSTASRRCSFHLMGSLLDFNSPRTECWNCVASECELSVVWSPSWCTLGSRATACQLQATRLAELEVSDALSTIKILPDYVNNEKTFITMNEVGQPLKTATLPVGRIWTFNRNGRHATVIAQYKCPVPRMHKPSHYIADILIILTLLMICVRASKLQLTSVLKASDKGCSQNRLGTGRTRLGCRSTSVYH